MRILVNNIIFKDGFTFAEIASWDFDCYTSDGFFKFKGEITPDEVASNYRYGYYDVCSEVEESIFD